MFPQMKQDLNVIMQRDPAVKSLSQGWRPCSVIPGCMPSGSIV